MITNEYNNTQIASIEWRKSSYMVCYYYGSAYAEFNAKPALKEAFLRITKKVRECFEECAPEYIRVYKNYFYYYGPGACYMSEDSIYPWVDNSISLYKEKYGEENINPEYEYWPERMTRLKREQEEEDQWYKNHNWYFTFKNKRTNETHRVKVCNYEDKLCVRENAWLRLMKHVIGNQWFYNWPDDIYNSNKAMFYDKVVALSNPTKSCFIGWSLVKIQHP